MGIKDRIDTQKFFIALLLSFVALQVVFFLLAEFDIMPMIKMGWAMLMMLVVIGMISLFVTGRKIGTLDLKKDGPFIILVMVGVVVSFIFLPQVIPQIFSTSSIQISEIIKNQISSIIKMDLTSIVG